MRSSRPDHRPDPPAGDDEDRDHQEDVVALLDDFHEHDMAALAELDAGGRAAQVRARQALYDHVDAVWDGAKERGLSPADLPEYGSVAAMRDLANELLSHAVQAQDAAGDDTD